MRMLSSSLAILLGCSAVAAAIPVHAKVESGKAAAPSDDNDVSATPPVVTHHVGRFGGQSIHYTATAARMPVDGPDGTIDAQLFYAAYTQDGAAPAKRPITFVMNGGPGSGTAWLHIGALGPQKIALAPDGSPLAPPARLEDNPSSPLDKTDLVMIDAPATGYSRVANNDAKGRLFDKDGDIGAFASFIRRYLDENDRWGSPLYLFGESYGGHRAAGLSDELIRRGVPVKGVILLSSSIDYLTLTPGLTNDLPYVLLIPSYAAIASFHGRADASLPHDPTALIAQAQDWALHYYYPVLLKGNRLTPEERSTAIAGLARYTGLAPNIIDALNLRIDVPNFEKYLQADRGLVTGRVDGRLSGPQTTNTVEEPWYDPAMGALTPAFTAATEQYLRTGLHYHSTIPYRMYAREVAARWGSRQSGSEGAGGYAQTLSGLQSTAVKNPDFRILVLAGIYDLASPFWTTEFDMDHMPMPAAYRRNITEVRLPTGHMAYDDETGLRIMSQAVRTFYDQSAGPSGN